MKIISKLFFTLIIIGGSLSLFSQATTDSVKSTILSSEAYSVLNIPKLEISPEKEIVIAVIDDGFRLSHDAIKDFIYTNNKEIPGNLIDDDNNGYIDDYKGWDISDNDSDVIILKSNEADYYHGTFIASLITRIVSESLEEDARKKIKILPIKVLSDNATTTAIRDGYLGIKYAIDMGVDIICCAWSGGNPSQEEINIINQALQKNIIIISSAGNTYLEKIDFPASIPGVFAVASLDTLLKKKRNSNYGMRIDLSLPGEKVKAAYPIADNAWFYGEGTSAAAGLTTGCAAILKAISPEAQRHEIIEALKNTASPIDSLNIRYCGKLGAGLPNLTDAVKYILNSDSEHSFFNSKRPEGTIYISKKNNQQSWEINPVGAYQGIKIIPDKIEKKDQNKEIYLYTKDSLFYHGTVLEIKEGIQLPGNKATIRLNTKKRRAIPNKLKLNYFVETIDSTSLFCSDIQHINADKGIISDNSGNENYTNNCTCSWLINAPESKRIHFSFTDFDTEAKVDFVWLFDGKIAHQDNIIAKFSGPEIPPSVTSRTNQVLIWFVTDDKHTAKGWTLQFEGK